MKFLSGRPVALLVRADGEPILGSDQVYCGDGRWSRRTLVAMAKAHALRLNRSDVVGIRLSVYNRGPWQFTTPILPL